MTIAKTFLTQATACEMLGSPFTARVLRMMPEILTLDSQVIEHITHWPGDASSAGDNVPLRLMGGLHALVRSGRDPDLAAVYPPAPDPRAQELKQAVIAALERHDAFLLDWMKNAPQTNEVGRSAVLIAAGRLISGLYDKPLRLLELGASAGLNLYWDRYALDSDGTMQGAAPLTLRPAWYGDQPLCGPIRVATRAGVDLNPFDVTSDQDCLRLLSYIWPDQPERLARTQSAIDVARKSPITLDRGDAAHWLEDKLSKPRNGLVTVVFNTVAFQYFPQTTQNRITRALELAGAKATEIAPLVWLSMEADGDPKSAALALRLWPGNMTFNLGRADFHGRWVNWQAPKIRGG